MHHKYKIKLGAHDDLKLAHTVRQRNMLAAKKDSKRVLFKTILFFSLLIFYIKLLFVDGFAQFIFPEPVGVVMSRSGAGGLAMAFVAAMIFIWLPVDLLDRLDKNWNRPVPGFALKFFGWVMFLVPAFVYLGYYFLKE